MVYEREKNLLRFKSENGEEEWECHQKYSYFLISRPC
jgi:hypothetical protein